MSLIHLLAQSNIKYNDVVINEKISLINRRNLPETNQTQLKTYSVNNNNDYNSHKDDVLYLDSTTEEILLPFGLPYVLEYKDDNVISVPTRDTDKYNNTFFKQGTKSIEPINTDKPRIIVFLQKA